MAAYGTVGMEDSRLHKAGAVECTTLMLDTCTQNSQLVFPLSSLTARKGRRSCEIATPRLSTRSTYIFSSFLPSFLPLSLASFRPVISNKETIPFSALSNTHPNNDGPSIASGDFCLF